MKRRDWIAWLTSDDPEAKEFLRVHPQLKPSPDNWKDPAFRERHAAALREKWKDPAFRERNAAASRVMLKDRWKDPAFRERHAAALRAARQKRFAQPGTDILPLFVLPSLVQERA